MTDKQPEALRLADRLEADAQGLNLGAEGMGWEPSANNMHDAATELRRLHEVNAELVEALRMLVEMCDAVGNFENGVTDETNSFDEGTFYAGKVIDKAKAAIRKATGEQQ
jgi:hypothetical protein